MKQIDVAVAVIHYENKYLLGFRNASQHQGNRYEFVGGKIEANERAEQALCREVYEEIGLDISCDSKINRMGVLRHEYADTQNPANSKKVCLHVYRVTVTQTQYELFESRNRGCEGQLLKWVDESDLIAGKYVLPDANVTILKWLSLPNLISITLDINQIDEPKAPQVREEIDSSSSDSIEQLIQNWVTFYSYKLATNAGVYIRLKQLKLSQKASALQQLIEARPDLKLIISTELAQYLQTKNTLPSQVIAQHLSKVALESLFTDKTMTENDLLNQSETENHQNSGVLLQESKLKELTSCVSLPMTMSCHSAECIHKVNRIAGYLLNNISDTSSKATDTDQGVPNIKPAIAGVFISPIKATLTHPNAEPLGWQAFSKLASHSEVPVIGLGGLSPLDLEPARHHGADKIAGIRQFLAQSAY